MSVRTFIFCDACNPLGIRTINNRRSNFERRDINNKRNTDGRRKIDGRRNSDGRAWYEGTLESGIEHGWVINNGEFVVCPSCDERGLADLVSSYTN